MTLTPSAIRALVNGWRGRFFFDAERGDLAYIASDCDERRCDCEQKPNADGDQDYATSVEDVDDGLDDVAKMLNAVPALLARVEELEKERDALKRHYDAASPEHNLLALLDLYEERADEAGRQRDAALREADRWRHGKQIEGDYVCPRDLECDELKALLLEALGIAETWIASESPHAPERADAQRLAAIRQEAGEG